MLRHNPYSLLRSTARTNLVERSYSQFFFLFVLILFDFYFELKKNIYILFALSFGSFILCLTLCFPFPLSHFEPP